MDSLKIKLVSKKQIAKDTVLFFFAKPKSFKFIAGQYCDWFLPEVSKSKIETGIRSLSIASAPFETELMISIRLRNTAFKNKLNSLSKGEQIIMNGPQGDLILEKSKNPLVLIAGGIGVTPFRSIALQAAHEKSPRKIFLFHFNKNLEAVSFHEEFLNIKNENFKYIPVITRDQNWSGEKGHFNKKILEDNLTNFQAFYPSNIQFYLAGSPEVVRAVKKELMSLKISEDSIRQEEFDGY